MIKIELDLIERDDRVRCTSPEMPETSKMPEISDKKINNIKILKQIHSRESMVEWPQSGSKTI